MEKQEKSKGSVWAYKFDGDILNFKFEKCKNVNEAVLDYVVKEDNNVKLIKNGRELN